MNASQIAWAARHDWFVADNGDGSITVADRWVDKDGRSGEENVVMNDFRTLRDWAGY